MVPDARGNVSNIVSLATGHVRWLTIHIRGPPTAVLELLVGQPVVSPLRRRVFTRNTQTHGGLSMVPGVSMPPFEPGDLAVIALRGQ